MCLLSVNGADEDEAEEAESFYESRIVCGPIRELSPFNDLFSYDSFWEPAGFLPYQQFSHVKLPRLPLLNAAPPFAISTEVIADIIKLSEHILKIYHPKSPTPFEAPFKLHHLDYTTYMQPALLSFLQIISTPDPNGGSRDWKIQTFTRCFEDIWKSRLALLALLALIEPTHSISDQEIIELNSNLRQSLALALDFKQGINFPNLLQREYRSLSNWAHTCTENISEKPVEALLVICLMKSCVNWRPPPPPMPRSASYMDNLNLGNWHVGESIIDANLDAEIPACWGGMERVANSFPMSTRRKQLLYRSTVGNTPPSTMARATSLPNLSQAFPSKLAPLPGQIHLGATGSTSPHHKGDSDSDSDSDSDDEGPFY